MLTLRTSARLIPSHRPNLAQAPRADVRAEVSRVWRRGGLGVGGVFVHSLTGGIVLLLPCSLTTSWAIKFSIPLIVVFPRMPLLDL